MATSEYPKPTDDLVRNNVLDILPDKILQLLPIRDAARISVSSKQLRCRWLSLMHLVFDEEFFECVRGDWLQCNNIISRILLNHDGPVHQFTLHIPGGAECINLSEWLSFLSKNDVTWIDIKIRCIHRMPISSNIFWCTELNHLYLFNMTIHPLPSGFNGFPKLQYLVLAHIQFSREYIFPGLMAKCPKLASLTINNCAGMGDIVIDAPNLETIFIFCLSECKSIAFRDVRNLKNIDVWVSKSLTNSPTSKAIDSFNNLASSRQLQCIEFNGVYFKFLAAGGFKKARPFTFNNLNKLFLSNLRLSAPDVLRNIFDMLECCPYIKELYISILPSENDNHDELECTKVHKSTHLHKVEITGITGSDTELQLIKYLLTVAVALERLVYTCRNHDTESEMKLAMALLGMPRASPKACIVCLR